MKPQHKTKPKPNQQTMEISKGDPEEIFEMLEKIGEGAYGIVCKCRNKRDGKTYAVKVIDTEGEDDSAIRKEIEILKSCDSEKVVRYGGCYKKGSTLLIAMEFCDGGSAQDVVRACKIQLNEDQISAICAQVLEALVYLHAKHIMHRDIKCGNILLTRRGEAKLADFGVSAQLNSTFQKKNTVIGSPYWMAPEMIAKATDGYDYRADIWSLGITAIEMADREPPRYDIHFARVIFIIPHQPPPTFKNPKEWSEDFVDFVTKCLKKEATDRPSAKMLLKHPFIVRGKHNSRVIADLVTLAGPKLQEHRKRCSERGQDDDDTSEDSDTVVRGMATVEIRGTEDDDSASNTFVENQNDDGAKIKGVDLNNLKTYA